MSEDRVPWQESNLSLVGSDLDHKIKQAAAENEAQWQGLGEEACLKVWRIEQFCVVPWPEDQHGKFHTGDSYVVLNSCTESEDNPKLLHDIHIWIGNESSQDEYGTAAYKMVEADDFLGDAAIQHREVEGHESPLFQSYFESSLVYLQGGTASGFTHVEPTVDVPHLYRVKGTEKAMSLTQVPVSKNSLNEGDSFILAVGTEKVWLWNGVSSNPDERARANILAEGMASQGTVVVLDQGDGDEDHDDFWNVLGDGEIQQADEAGGDDDVTEFTPTLFKLSGDAEEGPVEIAQGEPIKIGWAKATPRIQRDLLEETNVFLLDAGWDIYLWIGKAADRSERLAAMGHADTYCEKFGRPKGLPVTLFKQGYESLKFKEFFFD